MWWQWNCGLLFCFLLIYGILFIYKLPTHLSLCVCKIICSQTSILSQFCFSHKKLLNVSIRYSIFFPVWHLAGSSSRERSFPAGQNPIVKIFSETKQSSQTAHLNLSLWQLRVKLQHLCYSNLSVHTHTNRGLLNM